jgi:hypothetical protein
LADYVSNDGWRWEFTRPKVRELLRKMRAELYEVFGEGEYFHIGCDEGFSYPWDERSTQDLCDYLHGLCEEVLAEGRIPMLWADQLLHEPTLGISLATGYEGNAPTQEIAERLLNAIPKEALLCDWQYFVKETPWKSAKYLTEKGRKVVACPSCYELEDMRSSLTTAEELGCYAVLYTTWAKHYTDPMPNVLFDMHDLWFERAPATKKVGNVLENATLLRKIWFADGDYESAGFVKKELDNRLSF